MTKAVALFLIAAPLTLALSSAPPQSRTLTTTSGLTTIGVELSAVSFKGRKAVRAVERARELNADDAVVIVDGLEFGDGTIELDLAGEPAPGSSEGARGFVGIAFRTRPDAKQYEVIYIRPTNGRANDQVRRNHSTQYASHPEYPWHRLRKENPGVYESYADMQPSTWTKLKIVVKGQTARLHLNGAEQPCLIVNDLKLGSEGGGVALWVGAEAVGYFSNLVVRPD